MHADSREQAFVQALSSATLVHAIAKACSSGQSSKCGCGPVPSDPPPTPPPGAHQHGSPHGQGQAVPGQFKWGGCADDLRFGLVFGKWFTDMPSSNGRKMSRRAVINSHNNGVGRKAISILVYTRDCCLAVSMQAAGLLTIIMNKLWKKWTLCTILHFKYSSPSIRVFVWNVLTLQNNNFYICGVWGVIDHSTYIV